MADKPEGRGIGKFAVAGHEASQEGRIGAIEDYLSDLIDAGTLPAPTPEATEEPAEPTPA